MSSAQVRSTTTSEKLADVSECLPAVQAPVRRRLSATQGRAVEMLGHAIEYLVDTRLASADEFRSPATQEAIELLSGANRKVYLAAPEVRSGAGRVVRWLVEHLFGRSL